MVYVPKSSRD